MQGLLHGRLEERHINARPIAFAPLTPRQEVRPGTRTKVIGGHGRLILRTRRPATTRPGAWTLAPRRRAILEKRISRLKIVRGPIVDRPSSRTVVVATRAAVIFG